MKKRITTEQLQELTKEQLQRLRDLWKMELGDYIVDFDTEDGKPFEGITKYIKFGTEKEKPPHI